MSPSGLAVFGRAEQGDEKRIGRQCGNIRLRDATCPAPRTSGEQKGNKQHQLTAGKKRHNVILTATVPVVQVLARFATPSRLPENLRCRARRLSRHLGAVCGSCVTATVLSGTLTATTVTPDIFPMALRIAFAHPSHSISGAENKLTLLMLLLVSFIGSLYPPAPRFMLGKTEHGKERHRASPAQEPI